MNGTVTLGYHSPTEWVFFPEVAALYRSVTIRDKVYDRVVERGRTSPSGYERAKADLLVELERIGVLTPAPYDVPVSDREKLGSLIDHFFDAHPEQIRHLGITAFRSFISHEEGTLERLVSPEDPHYQDVAGQTPRLRRVQRALEEGHPLSEIPKLKRVLTGYFEDALLTPLVAGSSYNPVFQWEGYAPFQDWLVSLRRADAAIDAAERVRTGSTRKVLRSVSEIAVPFRPVKTPAETSRLQEKWEAFESVREMVARLNREIWTEVDGAPVEAEEPLVQEFALDFEASLDRRIKSINRRIEEIDGAKEQKKSQGTQKLIRALIATLGSIVPGTGGLAMLLDDLYLSRIERQVRASEPSLRAVFDYERVLSEVALERGPLPARCHIEGPYDPRSYWDV